MWWLTDGFRRAISRCHHRIAGTKVRQQHVLLAAVTEIFGDGWHTRHPAYYAATEKTSAGGGDDPTTEQARPSAQNIFNRVFNFAYHVHRLAPVNHIGTGVARSHHTEQGNGIYPPLNRRTAPYAGRDRRYVGALIGRAHRYQEHVRSGYAAGFWLGDQRAGFGEFCPGRANRRAVLPLPNQHTQPQQNE